DDAWDHAPQVLPPVGGPFVGELAHRRGGRDRVDRDDLARAVRDGSRRLVSIDRDRAFGSLHFEATIGRAPNGRNDAFESVQRPARAGTRPDASASLTAPAGACDPAFERRTGIPQDHPARTARTDFW